VKPIGDEIEGAEIVQKTDLCDGISPCKDRVSIVHQRDADK
jgi:hypothetical protein